jgi:hypothetical protein
MIPSTPLQGVARRILIVFLWFGAASAFGGAVLAIVANGAGVPLSLLDGTPFTSFLVPGLILGIVIGGTQALAAVALHRAGRSSAMTASVAGFGMVIWVFVELALISEYFWLQGLYFGVGIAQLGLVLVLLNVLNPHPQSVASPRSVL